MVANDSKRHAPAAPLSQCGIPQRYIMVLLTFLATCVCYVERVGFSIAYTATATRSGTDQATKGWVLSAFYYGYASSQVPGGWASQRLGGRRVLLLSFLLWSICCITTPTKPGPILGLIFTRLLVGVAQGFIFPSIHTVLAQWIPPHERSRSVSLTTSGMYFGAAIAMLLLPGLVASRGPDSVFQLVAGLGITWGIVWMQYSVDPPSGATGFVVPPTPVEKSRLLDSSDKLRLSDSEKQENGEAVSGARKVDIETTPLLSSPLTPTGGTKVRRGKDSVIPWGRIFLSAPVWAIVVNNFTFHYALYVLMNWLPTYFDQGLQASLHTMGAAKMMPYFVMFIFSNVGGVVADHFITRRIFSVTGTRKLLNTLGFLTAAVALLVMPHLHSVPGAVFCSSAALGACALARAGFAVNHLDIAPRYAGILMGVSNTAGTVAGVVGVAATGLILEAAADGSADKDGWALVFGTPAVLCVISALVFCLFSTGERVFD
eukprot:TRINITY_DN2787_c0_g1_i1.p1 TRINITY_DN2787_c0_g1~~TRINITY_DN2787_c0_g1_i1.p1  ORF type:complete len:488 (+),score=16.49 TRINITY_DN2787_c0_g1_i1:403-1866(+)